jgi:hypothetical protein
MSQPLNQGTPMAQPTPALIRRWKSMPTLQARRARAAWFSQQGSQDPAVARVQAEAAAAVRQTPREDPTAPRRLTNEELAARTARRAELDNPGFAGTLTEEDLAIASSATVSRWLHDGRIYHDLDGPPPGRQR